MKIGGIIRTFFFSVAFMLCSVVSISQEIGDVDGKTDPTVTTIGQIFTSPILTKSNALIGEEVADNNSNTIHQVVTSFEITNANLRTIDRFRNEEVRANGNISSIEFNIEDNILTFVHSSVITNQNIRNLLTSNGILYKTPILKVNKSN